MLRKQLIEHKETLEAARTSKLRRFSLLGRHRNTGAEISAINKFLIDLDMHAVKYSDMDMNVLKSGRIKSILDSYPKEIPAGFRNYNELRLSGVL